MVLPGSKCVVLLFNIFSQHELLCRKHQDETEGQPYTPSSKRVLRFILPLIHVHNKNQPLTDPFLYFFQIPIGSGKGFVGLVDLITKQRMTWRGNSWAEDGRAFETRALQTTDDPEFLNEVNQGRATLIEQVQCN